VVEGGGREGRERERGGRGGWVEMGMGDGLLEEIIMRLQDRSGSERVEWNEVEW
jgi:hypothetical protein